MAAQIPIKGDEQANEAAFAKVREDKRREATDGHDGTWVAHPGLVPVAMEEFNSICRRQTRFILENRETLDMQLRDLLEVPRGTITEEGFRINISVGRSIYCIMAMWKRSSTDLQS